MVRREDNDKVIWKEAKKALYSVKSFYAALKVGRAAPFSNKHYLEPIGKQVGEKLTLDNLQKRGRSLVHRCYLCKLEGKSIYHILLHCYKARILWHILFSLFNVD